ncbi:MAG: NUDIX domain-containing protein [Burkholderiaceae bacterium]|nr:NUDIX domain-containing protein [Burkholderiaceae bacterium]
MQNSLFDLARARTTLAGRYAQLNLRAQEQPAGRADAVTIAGTACGWATQAACDALQDLACVRLDAQGLHIASDLPAGSQEVDACLTEIAQRLRDADCLRGWRDERLDVWGGKHVVGGIERAAARPLGLRTRAVHLNAWTPDGKLWIARRAMSKSTDPGMWDTLVGGLVGAGETLDEALVRECDEEAGLDLADIAHRAPLRTILRMHRRLPEGYQVEDLLVADCVLAAGVTPANRDGEVEEIAVASPAEVLDMLDAGAFTLEAALVLVEDMMRAGALLARDRT